MTMEDATRISSVYRTARVAGRVRAQTTRKKLAPIPVIHLKSVLNLVKKKSKKKNLISRSILADKEVSRHGAHVELKL